ncbi:hypothetical protein Droror1_Dr00001650 [Drosera rotundifolia]
MFYVAKTRYLFKIIRVKSHHESICNFSSTWKKKKKTSCQSHIHPAANSKIMPAGKENYSSLFNDIIGILGSENLILDRNPHGTKIRPFGIGQCTEGVRQNDAERSAVESETETCAPTSTGDAPMVVSDGGDVSPLVQNITEIVRDENADVSMEERLDDRGFTIDCDVAEKVLKRCFKVPYRALRFFDWAKLRNEGCCSTAVYNTMLYIAGEAKEFVLVENLVKEMEEGKCEKDVRTWTILLMQYGKAKLIGKALLIFDEMRVAGCEPDGEAYRVMVRLLSTAGKGDVALEFYNEMIKKGFGLELDIKSYRMLLNCLTGSGDQDGVYSVADGMINASQIPESDVYSCVLKSFCVSKRIKEALELIRDLRSKNLAFNSEYLETLVKGLCKADRIDDAVEIVGIMKRRGAVTEKVYGAIISGYLKKKDIFKALDLFQTMKESGLMPSISTYTELMHHHFSLNEFEKGSTLFDEMIRSRVELDTVAFMPMVAAHVRQNSLSLAWEVFDSMEKRGIKPPQKCYSVFIKELCRISRTDEVFKVLDRMQESKVAIGEEIFHVVVSYLQRKGETAKAEELKRMQRLCKLQPLECEASSDNVSMEETDGVVYEPKTDSVLQEPKAGSVLLEPKADSLMDFDDENLQKICSILSSSKDWHAMEKALQDLKIHYTPSLVMETLHRCSFQGSAVLHFFSWVRKRPGYHHTAETYNSAIKIAGRGKDFKHMRSLFNEMERNGFLITSDTWAIMILLYGRAGLTDIALRIFGQMKASRIQPTASTYKYLILSLCGTKGRNVDEAIKSFDEMIGIGLVPDKELIGIYLECLCQNGKLEDASRCVALLGSIGFTLPLRYSFYIRALCRANKLEEALAFLNSVKDNDQSTLHQSVNGSLVHALLRRGRLDEALARVGSMKRAGIPATAHVYTSLMIHFIKENEAEKALDMFRKMQEEGCQPTVVTYNALVSGLASTRNFVDARNLLRRMRIKGPFPDFKTYSTIISTLCDKGRAEDAMPLLSEMLDDGIIPSTVNFRTVFFGLNREGKHDLAHVVMQQKQALIRNRKY